ncbi:MAG TPA: DUF4062 domain-containing protein [bacterium]|nr:DUF4062 domain-containing protein [bacterium]
MEKVKIMVSSTQDDLQAERDAAQEVIEKLGHKCLRSETHPCFGESPCNVCLEMAKTCHIYIGIFGKRYGFVPEGEEISITELEYRRAREHHPSKILVYIKEEEEYEDAQANFLEEVQNFKMGYFRRPKFKSAEELKPQIRADVRYWICMKIAESFDKDKKIQILTAENAYLNEALEVYKRTT